MGYKMGGACSDPKHLQQKEVVARAESKTIQPSTSATEQIVASAQEYHDELVHDNINTAEKKAEGLGSKIKEAAHEVEAKIEHAADVVKAAAVNTAHAIQEKIHPDQHVQATSQIIAPPQAITSVVVTPGASQQGPFNGVVHFSHINLPPEQSQIKLQEAIKPLTTVIETMPNLQQEVKKTNLAMEKQSDIYGHKVWTDRSLSPNYVPQSTAQVNDQNKKDEFDIYGNRRRDFYLM